MRPKRSHPLGAVRQFSPMNETTTSPAVGTHLDPEILANAWRSSSAAIQAMAGRIASATSGIRSPSRGYEDYMLPPTTASGTRSGFQMDALTMTCPTATCGPRTAGFRISGAQWSSGTTVPISTPDPANLLSVRDGIPLGSPSGSPFSFGACVLAHTAQMPREVGRDSHLPGGFRASRRGSGPAGPGVRAGTGGTGRVGRSQRQRQVHASVPAGRAGQSQFRACAGGGPGSARAGA